MPQKDHLRFLQLIERLRSCAAHRGEHALATALGECALNVSGGGGCPMGRLVLEDAVETGVLPGSRLVTVEHAQDAEPVARQVLPPEIAKRLLYRMWKQKAVRDRDSRFLQALEQCMHYVEHSQTCPLYRHFHRFHPDDPTPAGSESPLTD